MFLVSAVRSRVSYSTELKRLQASMSTILDQIPNVEIDPVGVFKYILIRVYVPLSHDGDELSKLIVRGNVRGPYHADIYHEAVDKLSSLKVDTECIGGGRISHSPEERKINVYGYSQGFGAADHSETVKILKKDYPGYNITWSNEGY